MLVLTCRDGEKIMIGDDIVIRVVRLNSVQVQLGIEAPRKIPVHREKVYIRIKEGAK